MAFSRLITIALLTTPLTAHMERAAHLQAPGAIQVAAADDKFVETGVKGEVSRPHAPPPTPSTAPRRTIVIRERPAAAPQENTHSDDYVCEHGDPQSDLTIDACFRRDHAHN